MLNTHLLGGIPRTRLDHVYVDASSLTLLRSAHVLHEPASMALSDHCPVYVALRCIGPPHQPKPPPQPPPPPRLELPHHDSRLVERFQQRMLHWTQQYSTACPSEDPQEAATVLGALMGATTTAVEHVTRRRRQLQQRIGHRSRFKDGFSLIYCALQRALLLLLALQRDLHREQRRPSGADVIAPRARYLKSLRSWHQRYTAALIPAAQHSTLHAAAALLTKWSTDATCSSAVADDIATLRHMMHGRKRTEWRRQQSERTELLEEMRVAQRFKQLFRRIGIKERT